MGGTAAAFPAHDVLAPAFLPAAAFPTPAFVPARAGVGFGTCGSWASSFFPGTHLPFFPELQGDKSTALAGRHGAGDEGDDAYRKRKRRTVAGVVQGEGEEETRRGEGEEDEETRQFESIYWKIGRGTVCPPVSALKVKYVCLQILNELTRIAQRKGFSL